MAETDMRRLVHPDVCHCVWQKSNSEPLIPNLCPTRYQALMFISERLGQGVSCCHLVRRPVEPKPTLYTSRPCTPSNSVISNQLPWKQHHNNRSSDITKGGVPQPEVGDSLDMRRARTVADIFRHDGRRYDGRHDDHHNGCHDGRNDVAAAIAFQEQLLLGRLNLHTRLLDVHSVPILRVQRSFAGQRSSTGSRPEVHWDDAGVGISGVSGDGGESAIWLPQMYQRQESVGDAVSEFSREYRTMSSAAVTVNVGEEVENIADMETSKQPECTGSGECVEEGESPMPPQETESQLIKGSNTYSVLNAKTARPPAMKKPVRASVIMSYDIRDDNIPVWRRAAEKRIHLTQPKTTDSHQQSSVNINVTAAAHPRPAGLSRAPSFTFGQLDQASRRLSRLISGTASSFQSSTEYCHRMATPTSGKSAGYRKRGTYSSTDDMCNAADHESFQEGYDDEDMLCEDISALPFPPSPTPRFRRKVPYKTNLSSSSGIIEYTNGMQKSERPNNQSTSSLPRNSINKYPANQRPSHDATCIVGHRQTSFHKPHISGCNLQYGGIGYRKKTANAQKCKAGSPRPSSNQAARCCTSGNGIPSPLRYAKRGDSTGERSYVKTKTIIDIRLGDLGRTSAGSRASDSDITSEASTARRFCSPSRSSIRSAFR